MHDGFDKAQASFRDHAARLLKLPADQLQVSPVEADEDVQLDQRVGGAWAFAAITHERPARQARGWALADGTVISADDNFGRLLEQAGVWSGKPTRDAAALAQLVAWSLGQDGAQVRGQPALNVDGKGAGTLSFQLAWRPPGPGGAGGGPSQITQFTFTLTHDHHAKLKTAPVAADVPRGLPEL